MEHALHELPLLIGSATRSTILKHGHISLPFFLTGQRGQSGHGRVPVEIEWRLYDHKQAIAENVYLHLEDAYRADTLHNLRPNLQAAKGLLVFGNQLGVIFQI